MQKDDFFQSVNKAQDQDAIEGLVDNIRKSDKGNPLCNFNFNKVPEDAPVNEKFAYLARKVALEINSETQGEWQHYWFRCCISSKCNYIFKMLDLREVNRENDLIRICNPQSSLYKSIVNENIKQSYFDLCIDFLLKRYNLREAIKIYLKSPNKKKNKTKLFIPRMLAANLVGFTAIVTSSELLEFSVVKQPYLIYYCLPLIIASVIYLSYECRKVTQDTTIPTLPFFNLFEIPKRALNILLLGMLLSLIMSYSLTTVGLFVSEDIPETSIFCINRIIFYSVLAFFIGILIQLLWEEKSITEPL